MTKRQESLDALETLIDKHGVHDVLEMISDICGEKAMHISSAWQDHALASKWTRASTTLWRVAEGPIVGSL